MPARDTASGVDVRQFGAQGDGINDDSAALQAALNQLALFGGGRGSALLCPPGVYLIADGKTVTIPANMPDGLVILGTGDDVVLQLGSDPAAPPAFFFNVPDAVSVTFRNLRFRTPAALAGAVDKVGTTGTLGFSAVTADAGVRAQVAVGCKFLLEAVTEVGVDIAPQATAPAILSHVGDGLWTGNSQPRIIKGTVDPSAGAGVKAPEGSLFLRFVAGAGELWVKTGAADTAWLLDSTTVTPSSVAPQDANGLGLLQVIQKPFVATGAAADDVVIYDVVSPLAPFRFILLDTFLHVTAGVALSTAQLRTALGGGGVAVSDLFNTALGGTVRNVTQSFSAGVFMPGSTLTLRRSNGNTVGDAILLILRVP